MHAEAIKSLAGKLIKIAKTPRDAAEIIMTHSRKYGMLKLTRESRRQLDLAVQDFLVRSGTRDKFSFKVAERDIIECLTQHQDNIENLEESLTLLAEKYSSYEKVNHVYSVVQGLRLMAQPTILEGNVKLFKGTAKKIDEIIKSSNIVPPEDLQKLENYNSHTDEIRKIFKGKTVVGFEVNAEPFRAMELAAEEFGKLVDILRYAGTAIERRKVRIRLSSHPAQDGSLIVGNDDLSIYYTRPDTFQLDAEALELMTQLKCKEIRHLQSKKQSELTDLEERVLRAVKWFSSAADQEHDHGAYMHYVSALESLFTANDKSAPISATISDAVAFLLFNDATKRLEARRKVKTAYSVRSNIAHGATHNVEAEDLDYITGLTEVCIRVVIDKLKTFNTQDDFSSHIDELKYYGPGDITPTPK